MYPVQTVYKLNTISYVIGTIDNAFFPLRSFGHQGALYYVFLTSDPLKTSREYAVFRLRTRGPKMCTPETSRQTQRVSAFLFWLRQMIALLHASRGKLAARTKFL